MKRRIIIFGSSGSGKSTVLHRLSGHGYLCLDNVTAQTIIDLQAFWESSTECIAVTVQVSELSLVWEYLQTTKVHWEKIWLQGKVSDLVQRYHHDRHTHKDGSYQLSEIISHEQQTLTQLGVYGDWVIDTSSYNRKKMLEYIDQLFSSQTSMTVNFVSFGFRYGVMSDIDYLFDARFLENPYYYPELAKQTGNDVEVYDFVHQQPNTQEFLQHIISLLDQVLACFQDQKRSHVNIAIACSGGKHRSVSIVNYLYEHYRHQYSTGKFHRDIQKNKEEYS